MRNVIILLVAALFLALPLEANATLQCVTYAREVTGLNLKGDAWKWWEAASGVYERGNTPKIGSVLVFKRQGKMSHGHVSVVRGTAGSRVVLVDHANWAPFRSAGRGQVTKAVPVLDVSAKNDWSEVRVWYQPSREYGSRTYKTQGFVHRPSNSVVPASLRTEAPHTRAEAAKAGHPAALLTPKTEPMTLPQAVETPVAETPVAETPVAETPVAETPAAKAKVIEAKVIEAKVIEAKETPPAEVTAASAAEGDLGKFDARAWAEQS